MLLIIKNMGGCLQQTELLYSFCTIPIAFVMRTKHITKKDITIMFFKTRI